MKAIPMIGRTFGRLKVISEHSQRATSGDIRYNCICACGGTAISSGYSLRCGKTQSCGCFCKEQTSKSRRIHGQTGSKTHKSWTEMRGRCTNPKSKIYKYYGGRGITICERWNKFENFFEDMDERPEGTSIERINNSLGYFPDNCKWGTAKEQARNSRHNNIIKYQGKSQCLSAWAEELEIDYKALWARIKKYPPQIAFNM